MEEEKMTRSRRSCRIKARKSIKEVVDPEEIIMNRYTPKIIKRKPTEITKAKQSQKVRRGRRPLTDEVFFEKSLEKIEKYKAMLASGTLN